MRKLLLILLLILPIYSIWNIGWSIDSKSLEAINVVKNVKTTPIPERRARIKIIRIKAWPAKTFKAKISINNSPICELKQFEYCISDHPVGRIHLESKLWGSTYTYTFDIDAQNGYEYIVLAKAVGNATIPVGFEFALNEIIKSENLIKEAKPKNNEDTNQYQKDKTVKSESTTKAASSNRHIESCKTYGFKEKTVTMGECVLKLMDLEIQQMKIQNQIINAQKAEDRQILHDLQQEKILKEKNYNEGLMLLQQSYGILNSLNPPKTTCTFNDLMNNVVCR